MKQGMWAWIIVLIMVLGLGVTVAQYPAAAATGSRAPLAQTTTGSITTSDPTQQGRFNRDGVPSVCGAQKVAPTPTDASTLLHFDAYTFTNTTSAPVCYTVTLTTNCIGTNFIFSAAYLGVFNPANIQQNYLADLGLSPNSTPGSYSFTVAAGASFIVVVHETTRDAGCAAYTVDVTTPTSFPPAEPCLTYTQSSTAGQAVVPGTGDVGNHTDDGVTQITLPFAIRFYDQVFTQARVSANGNLQFMSSASGDFFNTALPQPIFNYAILPHWDDLRTVTAGDGIFISTSGVPPNRSFNIEWRAHLFGNGTTEGGPVQFEIRLREADAGIELIYGTVTNSGSSATIGLQQGTGAQFIQYSVNTASVASGLRITYTCQTPPPTETPTATVTATATETATATATETETATETATATATETETATATETPTLTETAPPDPSPTVVRPTTTATSLPPATPTAPSTSLSYLPLVMR